MNTTINYPKWYKIIGEHLTLNGWTKDHNPEWRVPNGQHIIPIAFTPVALAYFYNTSAIPFQVNHLARTCQATVIAKMRQRVTTKSVDSMQGFGLFPFASQITLARVFSDRDVEIHIFTVEQLKDYIVGINF